MNLGSAVLTLDDVAAIFGKRPSTIRRYISDGKIEGSPIFGSAKNGYLFPADKFVASLREKGWEGEARLVEQAVARMPEPVPPVAN